MPLTWMHRSRSVLSFLVPNSRSLLHLMVVAAGMGAYSASTFAEDKSGETDPFVELRQRLDQLEQDNRELRAALKQRGTSSIEPLVGAVPPAPGELEPEETEDERRIGSVVQKYMRRLNAQPQAILPDDSAEDSAQDQKIAMLERDVGGLTKILNAPKAAFGSYGNDGLFFTSNDGNFKTHYGGVVQMDYIGMGPAKDVIPPSVHALQDSISFRRLRWRAEGTMYKHIDYVMEFDFALALQNNDPGNPANPMNGLQSTIVHGGSGIQSGNTNNVMQPTTIFVTFNDVPCLGHVRVGNQQDWFSMEHIESARFLDFMERAPIMDAFSGANNNGYTPGISAYNNTEDKRAGLQLGFYKNNVYDAGYTFDLGNAWTYGGRAIWTPYYDEETKGRYMVHTGLGSEYRTFNESLNPQNQGTNIRIRSRGDLRNTSSTLDPNYADTGNFFVQSQILVDPEIAIQLGPLLLRAEYCASWLQGARPFHSSAVDLGTVFMQGGYAEALYFLTGENRDYNKVSGVFNRVIPKNNANFSECKYGAWQVGARYDWIDLNSFGINGGQAQDGTLGLNWFLNPNLRIQVNYVLTHVNNAGPSGIVTTNGALVGSKFIGDGYINSVGTRLDWTF
jgi:phosphate-selective porin OprO/OprP